MKKKKRIFYLLLSFSIIYLLVAYLLNNFRFESMMYHHYYSESSSMIFYLNSIAIWLGFSSFLILILLAFDKGVKKPKDLKELLDNRLERGEISINEYNEILKMVKK